MVRTMVLTMAFGSLPSLFVPRKRDVRMLGQTEMVDSWYFVLTIDDILRVVHMYSVGEQLCVLSSS